MEKEEEEEAKEQEVVIIRPECRGWSNFPKEKKNVMLQFQDFAL